MPKLRVLLFTALLLTCTKGKAQNLTSRAGRFSTDPMSVRVTDSLYRLQELQQVTHLQPKSAPRPAPTPVKPLPTIRQMFQTPAKGTAQQKSPSTSRPASTVCSTVSGRDFLYQDSLVMWTGIPSMTADGNILLSGEFANYNIRPLHNSGGFCMKTDLEGNVIWSMLYDSTIHLGYDFINYFRVIELANKDILLAGRTTNNYSGNADVIVTRTNSKGNIIWSKTYASRLWQGFGGSGDFFSFNDLKEDPANGDLFFVGSHWFSCVAVTKLNPATGGVVWSNAYDTYDSDYAFGLIIHPNSMQLFQLGNGYYNQSRINIISINKNTLMPLTN
jgi:hypothetical protein